MAYEGISINICSSWVEPYANLNVYLVSKLLAGFLYYPHSLFMRVFKYSPNREISLNRSSDGIFLSSSHFKFQPAIIRWPFCHGGTWFLQFHEQAPEFYLNIGRKMISSLERNMAYCTPWLCREPYLSTLGSCPWTLFLNHWTISPAPWDPVSLSQQLTVM